MAKKSENTDETNVTRIHVDNIEHVMFSTLFGLWLGFFFSDSFPDQTTGGAVFIGYALFFVGLLSVILRAGFARKKFIYRLPIYIVGIFTCFLLQPGLIYLAQVAFINHPLPPADFTWKLAFLVFVVAFWCIFGELGHQISRFLNNRARI